MFKVFLILNGRESEFVGGWVTRQEMEDLIVRLLKIFPFMHPEYNGLGCGQVSIEFRKVDPK